MFIDKRNDKKVVILQVLTTNTMLVKEISSNKKYIVDKEYLKKIT